VIADGAVGDPTTQYEVVPGQPADRTGPRVPEVDTWRKIDGEINDVYRRYGVAPADRQVRYGEKRLMLRALTDADWYQETVTDTTETTLIPVRQGSLVLLKWIQVYCTNATAVTVTLRLGPRTLWTVVLNADVGWWFEPAALPPDEEAGDLGGSLLRDQEALTFQASVNADIGCYAFAQYVQEFEDRLPWRLR